LGESGMTACKSCARPYLNRTVHKEGLTAWTQDYKAVVKNEKVDILNIALRTL